MTTLDPRRDAAVLHAEEQIVRIALRLRAHAGGEDVSRALADLPPVSEITVAQLAVACEQVGVRLVLEVEPR